MQHMYQHILQLQYQMFKTEQHMRTCSKEKIKIFSFLQNKKDNKGMREV